MRNYAENGNGNQVNDHMPFTGLEALVIAAEDADVEVAVAVPGYPITAIMENFFDRGTINANWVTNEKVALEIALGSSVVGMRSLVLTKHVGVNILSDTLITSCTHTIGSGIVIIAGDDPGVVASQNEQDSRSYGFIVENAVYDPSTPQVLYESIHHAFNISEKASMPVIIRVTNRILQLSSTIERVNTEKNSKLFDRNIWKLTMRGKHQRFHKVAYPLMKAESEITTLNMVINRGKSIGIISSGYVSHVIENDLKYCINQKKISHLMLTMIFPLPKLHLDDFIKKHEYILVIEETEPVIESFLNSTGYKKICGKNTGHLPYGLIEINDIEFAIENAHKYYVNNQITVQTIKERGSRSLCKKCPFIPLYNALSHFDVPIAGDLGCSILTAPKPFELVDTGFSLGSSISVAMGFKRKGIAIIGDFGLAHTGIIGLINATHINSDVLIIVLQNEIAAMTGGQNVPDLTKIVKTIVKDTTIIETDKLSKSLLEEDIYNIVNSKLSHDGVSVLLVRGTCEKSYYLD
ncbi:thiamine pyrophosphate-dependent enzyme [Methanosalsum natronophilum]|uniref:thiamine pyrophosphate-dependent enzyme n=1 Tax=Methanosalsum natronophilum TaxID=768733 RepID=UPI00216985C1|nr:thiamine pyrophosphate-dependent enzyme [Methanosalsum natronophilum]MCS3924628.1 indolepyruvate ferredoxin oxidoreductase alpha subunit [Methanosalsum natronophilum]